MILWDASKIVIKIEKKWNENRRNVEENEVFTMFVVPQYLNRKEKEIRFGIYAKYI